MLDISSLLFCMLILKKILKKYRNGWDILIKKEKNLKNLIPIAFLIGITLAIIHLLYISLTMPDTFKETNSTESFLILLFYGTLIAPFTEEIWFRSFIYRGIKKKYGTMIAFIYSIILFFLAHLFNFSFFPLLIFSITITAFYEKTRALYNTILIHATYNFVLFTLKQLLSMHLSTSSIY